MYSGGGSYFVVGRQVEADSGVGVIGEGAAAPSPPARGSGGQLKAPLAGFRPQTHFRCIEGPENAAGGWISWKYHLVSVRPRNQSLRP